MGIVAGIYCDFCGVQMNFYHIGKVHIINCARQKGWSVSVKDKREICRCPNCKKGKRTGE